MSANNAHVASDSPGFRSSCRILLSGGSAASRLQLASLVLQLLSTGQPGRVSTLSLPAMILKGGGDPVKGLMQLLPVILQRCAWPPILALPLHTCPSAFFLLLGKVSLGLKQHSSTGYHTAPYSRQDDAGKQEHGCCRGCMIDHMDGSAVQLFRDQRSPALAC